MSELPLLEPSQCVLVLVDEQAGLAFAAGSQDPQLLRSNSLAVAKTSVAFDVPVVISTSASKVYSGPLMPAFRAVLPDVVPIERRNMNLWEDDSVRGAIVATGKRTLIVAGLLTEACVSFPVLSALSEGYRVVVVADACGVPRHADELRAVVPEVGRPPGLDSPRHVRGGTRHRRRSWRRIWYWPCVRSRHDQAGLIGKSIALPTH